MTIDEAFGRVIRGHWLVILLCVLVPFGAAWYIGKNQPSSYEAVARIQMGSEAASSNVQADATSQRVLGIATSPGVVRQALDKAGLETDVATFAANNIDVRRVGVSPVMEIAVTDTSPRRAAVIATSLTQDVIEFSNVGDQPAIAQRRVQVQRQLDALAKQRAALVKKMPSASPNGVLALQAQLTSLTTTQGELERQLSDLDLSTATTAGAVLLDPVREPTIPLPAHVYQRAVLIALLGALFGVGLAAVLEAFRPRLPSPRAIARTLGVPHVGYLPHRDLAPSTLGAAGPIADRLALLARRYDATQLLLVLVDAREEAWARSLAPRLGPQGGQSDHRLVVQVLGREWAEPGERPVLVVLSPDQVSSAAIERTRALTDALGWPVVGLVSYPHGHRHRWLPRRKRSVALEAAALDEAFDRAPAAPRAGAGAAAPGAGRGTGDAAAARDGVPDPAVSVWESPWDRDPVRTDATRTDAARSDATRTGPDGEGCRPGTGARRGRTRRHGGRAEAQARPRGRRARDPGTRRVHDAGRVTGHDAGRVCDAHGLVGRLRREQRLGGGAARMSVWLRTAGLVVHVDGDEPWTELVRESCAGQQLSGPAATADVHVMVSADATVATRDNHRLVTRGAWTDGREVVLTDACSSGLDVVVRPGRGTLEVVARPLRGWRQRALGLAAPDRQVLLQRAVLVQYPALWWAGTRGQVPMHVSAATVDGYAVVLAGPGGVGKSTLVATLTGPADAPVSDNLCSTDGRVVHGLLEPTRAEGGSGRKMPHGRRESPWTRHVDSVRPDAVLVLSRGDGDAAEVTRIDPDAAARELVGGTYAAGELRRYWAWAATLALGTGLGPAHPPVAAVADALAGSVPVLGVRLPRTAGTTLGEIVDRVRALVPAEEVGS